MYSSNSILVEYQFTSKFKTVIAITLYHSYVIMNMCDFIFPCVYARIWSLICHGTLLTVGGQPVGIDPLILLCGF